MCGILAHFRNEENGKLDLKEFIEEMCFMRRRGDIGVGIVAVYDNGEFEVVKNMKKVLNMGEFIRDNYDKMETIFSNPHTWAVLMHGRKPAFAYGKNGTQPFYSDRFFLMHQGAVFSIFDFLPKNPNYHYYCDTDSERMLSHLMKFENDDDFDPVDTMVELYDNIGEIGVIAMYDKLTKNIYFYRDDVRWLYVEQSEYGEMKKAWNLKKCALVFATENMNLKESGIYKIKVGSSNLEQVKKFNFTEKTFLKQWRRR